MRRLIVNADDYGYSPLFNKGILELAKKKFINSASVMIKREYINPAELKKLTNLSIGLHLELKEKDTQKEIDKQLKKFISFFRKLPSHLDGHKHTHLTPVNLPKVIKIARKYDLPIRSHLPKDREIIKKAGLKTPDLFISWYPERKNIFFEKIKNARGRVIEIVCHPGYFDKNCAYPYNKEREEELKILKSKEFQNIIKKFKLINYTSF